MTIPKDILADTVTARLSPRDGLVIVEGRKNKAVRKISRQGFFSDSYFSLSIDLGDGVDSSRSISQSQNTIELF